MGAPHPAALLFLEPLCYVSNEMIICWAFVLCLKLPTYRVASYSNLLCNYLLYLKKACCILGLGHWGRKAFLEWVQDVEFISVHQNWQQQAHNGFCYGKEGEKNFCIQIASVKQCFLTWTMLIFVKFLHPKELKVGNGANKNKANIMRLTFMHSFIHTECLPCIKFFYRVCG